MNDPITIVIPPDLDGADAETAALQLSGLAAKAVATILARGGLWVNGRRAADPGMLVVAGSLLQLRTPPGGSYRDALVEETDILYEDEWLLVLNKRPGWYVGATPWDVQGSVLAGAARMLEQRAGVAASLWLAHQLDRDTSGVLVLSKRSEANQPLHHAFADRLVHKRYLGLCLGHPREHSFELQTGIGRGPGGGFYVYPLTEVGSRAAIGRPRVLAAQTAFRVIEHLRGTALIEALPITGRTHQIRLHLAHCGHPLLGDERYGGPQTHAGLTIPHHLLHAAYLELPHPATRQPISFEARLPRSFSTILTGLKHQ